MTNLPFGFGPGSGDPNDPSSQMPLFAELQKLLSWSGGPVNWDLAKQLAVSTLAGANSPVDPAERAAVADAIRLADLWLDEVTQLPSGVQTVETWTRLEWLDKTLPVWSTLCDPVAARVVRQPVVRKFEVELPLCGTTGLEQRAVARRDPAFKVARKLDWGDGLD